MQDNSSTPTEGLKGAVYFPRDPGTGATVTETARVMFDGVASTVRTTINRIEALLRQAAERSTRPALPQVYVEYRHTNAGPLVMRSPVVGGRVTWSEDPKLRDLSGAVATGEIAVIIERMPFWEGPQDNLGVTTIKNGNVAPYNRLGLNPPQGTMPTPIKITLTNSSGVSMDSRKFYFSVDSTMGLSGTTHLLTGGAVSWGANLTHSTRLWTLTIPASIITAAKGSQMQVIAAFSSFVNSDIYLKASLWTNYSGLPIPTYIAGGDVYTQSRKLINLGSLPIPPDGVSTNDLSLVISGYSVTAGSATLSFVQLTPAAGAVVIDQTGYNMLPNTSHVDDGSEARSYHLSGSTRIGILRRSGGPLLVYPGQTNSLFCLFDEGTAYNSSRQMTLNVSYRPRYATI